MYKITIEDKDFGKKEFITEGYIVSVIQQEGMHKGNLVAINGDDYAVMDIFMINFYSNFTNIMRNRFSTAPELFDIFNKTFLMLESLKNLTNKPITEKFN